MLQYAHAEYQVEHLACQGEPSGIRLQPESREALPVTLVLRPAEHAAREIQANVRGSGREIKPASACATAHVENVRSGRQSLAGAQRSAQTHFGAQVETLAQGQQRIIQRSGGIVKPSPEAMTRRSVLAVEEAGNAIADGEALPAVAVEQSIFVDLEGLMRTRVAQQS